MANQQDRYNQHSRSGSRHTSNSRSGSGRSSGRNTSSTGSSRRSGRSTVEQWDCTQTQRLPCTRKNREQSFCKPTEVYHPAAGGTAALCDPAVQRHRPYRISADPGRQFPASPEHRCCSHGDRYGACHPAGSIRSGNGAGADHGADPYPPGRAAPEGESAGKGAAAKPGAAQWL